jgi:hypothetical protein
MIVRRMVPPRRRELQRVEGERVRLTGRRFSERDAQIRAQALRWLVQSSHISAALYDRALAAGEAVVRGDERSR